MIYMYPGLKPLLGSVVGDKCTTVPILNAGLLPCRPDDRNSILNRCRAFEIRGID